MISEVFGIYETLVSQNQNFMNSIHQTDVVKKLKKFLRNNEMLMSRHQRFSLRSFKQTSKYESSEEESDSFSLLQGSIMNTVIELPYEEEPNEFDSNFDSLHELLPEG